MATFPLPASIPVRSHHIPLCPTPVLAPRPAAIPGLLFRRPCQGTTCQPHHTTAVPCLRFCNPHQIAACCMSRRSALHQPSQRAASVIAPHCVSPGRTQPSACNPTSRPRLPPSGVAGKPLPTPPAAPYRQREAAVLSTEHHGLSSPGARPAPRARPVPNPECFISQLARSALEPHCIRIGEAPDACHNCGAQAAPRSGTRSRHVG